MFRIIKHKIKNSNFWKSVAILASGSTISQIISFISTPLVSRIYTPENYGEYAVIISISTIILFIITLGLNSSIMSPKDNNEAEDIFRVSFYLMFVILLSIIILGIIFSPHLKFITSGYSSLSFFLVVFLIVFLNNTRGLLLVIANRNHNNSLLFYNSLIYTFLIVILNILFGIINMNNIGLLLSTIFALIISVSHLLLVLRPSLVYPKIETIKFVLSKYKHFVMYQYPSNFIENFAIQLPTQILGSRYGYSNLGPYSMNEKLLGAPSRLLGQPIGTIYFRTATEYKQVNKDLSGFTYSLITWLMLLSSIPILVLLFWGEQIFIWFLGSEWIGVGKMSSILIVPYMFSFCSTCTSYCRVVYGKLRLNTIISVLRVLIVGVSISLGIVLFGDLISTIITYSIGTSIYLIIDMFANFIVMKKKYIKYLLFATVYFTIIVVLWYLFI